ncbi:MAG: hypothetical protein ABGY96_14345 [bacterium]|nr:hypothetical protein [Gammaproteobacteria bacterium]
MPKQWGVNPQQSKTTHTKNDNGFLDEFYWDKNHKVLFRWWSDRGWIQTSTDLTQVSRLQRLDREHSTGAR